ERDHHRPALADHRWADRATSLPVTDRLPALQGLPGRGDLRNSSCFFRGLRCLSGKTRRYDIGRGAEACQCRAGHYSGHFGSAGGTGSHLITLRLSLKIECLTAVRKSVISIYSIEFREESTDGNHSTTLHSRHFGDNSRGEPLRRRPGNGRKG